MNVPLRLLESKRHELGCLKHSLTRLLAKNGLNTPRGSADEAFRSD